jgi:hypothetical protein
MKMMFRLIFAVLVASAAPSVPHTGSVEFTVLNRWGNSHNYNVLHFRISKTSPDLASAFPGLAASDIPFGPYDYELVPAPGDDSDEKLSGQVDVYRTQIHVTSVLETTDSLGHRAQVPVEGMLEPRPKGHVPVWIILQNVYGKFRDESTVDDRGGFQLHHIWGNNVIIVCAGSEVLMTALVSVRPNEVVNHLHVNLKTGKVDAPLMRF